MSSCCFDELAVQLPCRNILVQLWAQATEVSRTWIYYTAIHILVIKMMTMVLLLLIVI